MTIREFAKISPRFWIGTTGRRLRGKVEAQIVALYLLSAPGSSMSGVFYCPKTSIENETGLGREATSKGLRCLIEEGFVEYDDTSETVFVITMAAHQIGDQLAPNDKRVVWLRKEVSKMASDSLRQRFIEIYNKKFCLESEPERGGTREAPSMPHRSKEIEKKTEKKTKKRKEMRKKKEPPHAAFAVPDWIDRQAWDGFAEMRKRQRAPLTDRACAMVVKELDKLRALGHAPDAVLDESTKNSWKGVYPLKPDGAIAARTGPYLGRQSAIEANNRAVVAQLSDALEQTHETH